MVVIMIIFLHDVSEEVLHVGVSLHLPLLHLNGVHLFASVDFAVNVLPSKGTTLGVQLLLDLN